MTTSSIPGVRDCEVCGQKMPAFQPRHRNEEGKLVCGQCPPRHREGAKNEDYGIWQIADRSGFSPPIVEGDLEKGVTMVPVSGPHQDPREAEMAMMDAAEDGGTYTMRPTPNGPIVYRVLESHGYEARHQATKDSGDAWCAGCGAEIISEDGQWVWVADGSADCPGSESGTHHPGHSSSLQVEAHDSGDQKRLFHCPFCGSGNIIGSPSGTISCAYCNAHFTVQIQPEHLTRPQTNPITGEPIEQGTDPLEQDPSVLPNEGQAPVGLHIEPETAPPDLRVVPDIGRVETEVVAGMSRASYLRRLALQHTANRDATLEEIRRSRQEG